MYLTVKNVTMEQLVTSVKVLIFFSLITNLVLIDSRTVKYQ